MQGHQPALFALVALAFMLSAAAVGAAPDARIGNRALSLGFNRATGALTSARNLATGDEYLKGPGGPGNPFLIHVDPTVVPQAASNPGWWSGAVEEDLGGLVVTPAACAMTSLERKATETNDALTLISEHRGTGLRMRLTMKAPAGASYADLTLTITNTGRAPHTVVTAFPHLNGLSLGPDRESNLGLMQASYGTPDVKGWGNFGGWYGREVSMQWQAAYEPKLNEGVGLIVMDPETCPKLIRRAPGGVLSTLYYPGTPLAPGASHTYPTARLVIHRGDWRVTAQLYRAWFGSAFKPHPAPSWLRQVDMYCGTWIPSAEAVAKNKADDPANAFTSYERMPLLYRDSTYDLCEWAMYNQGVQDDPASYGPYMGDGTYYFRSDLGGPTAMREGVRRLHAMGRRIMFYVAGNSILRNSAVLKGQNADDWMLMDRPGKGYDIGYPNGFSVCPGYGPWQEQMARTARRILAESGADGIRLDEMASFVPCFNPAHKHANPYDSVRWMRELTRKVRAAMDEVNRDAILLTEGPLDAVHESCNGALQMFQPGYGIDSMRVAVPSLIGMAYHPGAVEGALNGWIGGKTQARRQTWPWEHRGLGGKPAWYAEGGGPETRWHELRASFAEAIVDGLPGAEDAVAAGEPRWIGRLWKGKQYWLVVGATLDASPLKAPITVRVPGLQASVKQGMEIDAVTLEARPVTVQRVAGVAEVTLQSAFSALWLPHPGCPPMAQASLSKASVKRGETLEVEITPSRRVGAAAITVTCPGLAAAPMAATLPGRVTLRIPADTLPGLYALRVEGECLPAKRWVRVLP